jgi:phytoene/squalene synthetase
MSLQACANLVSRADPERFFAAMAAPIAARAVLLPVYAASIEVARAPWLTQEPMIAEMRLQWWRDVFEEIETGRPRKHEVVDALAPVLGPKGAAALDAMVLARRWDIYKEGFNTAGGCVGPCADDHIGAHARGT